MKRIVTKHKSFVPEKLLGKDWESILRKGVKIIDNNKIYWQLGYGTLLGAIREKNHFIAHELDLDVDLIINKKEIDKLVSLREELLKNDFSFIQSQSYDNMPMSMAFVYNPTNIIFDMCIFYDNWGDDFYHIGEKGIVIRPKYTYSSRKVLINNYNYNVPKKAEDYLEGLYGDWKTPRTSKGDWFQGLGRYFIQL